MEWHQKKIRKALISDAMAHVLNMGAQEWRGRGTVPMMDKHSIQLL